VTSVVLRVVAVKSLYFLLLILQNSSANFWVSLRTNKILFGLKQHVDVQFLEYCSFMLHTNALVCDELMSYVANCVQTSLSTPIHC
jgi:hypothetical protein